MFSCQYPDFFKKIGVFYTPKMAQKFVFPESGLEKFFHDSKMQYVTEPVGRQEKKPLLGLRLPFTPLSPQSSPCSCSCPRSCLCPLPSPPPPPPLLLLPPTTINTILTAPSSTPLSKPLSELDLELESLSDLGWPTAFGAW